ncbi:MAG: aspartyl-tRNA synthetase [Planctomycetota bacterium]
MSEAPVPKSSWQRTHTCGDLRAEHVGQTVTLNGWVDARRNLGGLYFAILRDRYGKTQLLLPEDVVGDIHLNPEDVLSITGEVIAREDRNIRKDQPTGEVEVRVTHLEQISTSPTPPFEIVDDLDTSVELRLRYRFLDLRRPSMQHKLMHRSRFIGAMRNAFLAEEFIEVETPILTKATPEGARDYLVPSRVHPGMCYALPQSPQIFKQILMVSGMDRYFQVARCFRDEDLRADRQPEFTQLDMEMSFVEEEGVFATWERVMARTWKEAMGSELQVPFPRMTWIESMERYGIDKPDTRFGMELINAEPWAKESDFVVFTGSLEKGGRVMGLTIPGGADFSRGAIKKLEKFVKEYGAKGLAYWKVGPDTGPSSMDRFVPEDKAGALKELMGAEDGDMCVFVADTRSVTWAALGNLRNHIARQRDMIPADQWNFLWVTSFPMFEKDEETGNYTSSHHPFTAPADWDMSGDPEELDSRAYDMVLNGWELGSGSVRIHRADVQQRVFELLGISPEERQLKFGFLLDALAYGAPPHAGFAMGLDRVIALTLGLDSIRDVVAFPKTTSAADLMCAAPSTVSDEQMADVHISSTAPAPTEPETA